MKHTQANKLLRLYAYEAKDLRNDSIANIVVCALKSAKFSLPQILILESGKVCSNVIMQRHKILSNGESELLREQLLIFVSNGASKICSQSVVFNVSLHLEKSAPLYKL